MFANAERLRRKLEMWREPGKGDDREVDRRQTDNIGVASGIARLFGQVMLLPLVTFAYAVESFARAIWEIRQTSDRTLDAFTRSDDQLFEQANAPPPGVAMNDFGDRKHNSGATDYTALNVSAGVNRSNPTTEQLTETEAQEMTEQDLRGDDLKLVQWTASFIKRDKETALDIGIDLVTYSTTLGDYQGAKRDEFLRKLRKDGFERPQNWLSEKYPDQEYLDPVNNNLAKDLPPRDIDKYLRIYVEVLTRYEKQEPEYKKVKVVS